MAYRIILSTKIGSKFNRWTTLAQPFRKDGRTYCLCKCSCGTERVVQFDNVFRGKSKSCGCWNREATIKRNFKHGDTTRKKRERLYTIWADMLQRCKNPKNIGWKYYGGRGIKVCKQWVKYINFRKWALRSGYAPTLTIERINVNAGYKPSNCTWIPKHLQNKNKRNRKIINQ
jgi:hypothetical protein